MATLVEPIALEPEGPVRDRAVPVRRSRFYLWAAIACAMVGLAAVPPVSVAALPALLLELILVAGMVRDWRVLGRVHPAWIVGVVVIAGMEVVRAPISASPAWLGFASWAGHIAG